MKFTGVITTVCPEQSGVSKSGKQWQKQEYVLCYDNTNQQYPKSVVFSVMNDRIGQFNIQQGGQYEVELDFDAREYNGRYYMSANAWKCITLQVAAQATAVQTGYTQVQAAQPIAPVTTQTNDDLPF